VSRGRREPRRGPFRGRSESANKAGESARLNSFRQTYSAWHGPERTADVCLLAFGFALGVCGAIVMMVTALRGRHDTRVVMGVGVYAICLLAMLGCSLLYRSATEPVRRQFLRRFDHAAIFAMIAGSATPFAMTNGRFTGDIAAAALWTVAALGIVVKLSFPIGTIRRSAGLYLLLGWAALGAVGPAISAKTAMLIAAGGIFYSVGVVFLLSWRLPYRLAIWHAFVLAGAACHYAAIMDAVVFG
jgi:hemolysin III